MTSQKPVARPSVKGARILSRHRIPLPDSDRNSPEFGFVTEMASRVTPDGQKAVIRRGFRPFRSPKNLESSADAVLFWFANPTREKAKPAVRSRKGAKLREPHWPSGFGERKKRAVCFVERYCPVVWRCFSCVREKREKCRGTCHFLDERDEKKKEERRKKRKPSDDANVGFCSLAKRDVWR